MGYFVEVFWLSGVSKACRISQGVGWLGWARDVTYAAGLAKTNHASSNNIQMAILHCLLCGRRLKVLDLQYSHRGSRPRSNNPLSTSRGDGKVHMIPAFEGD